MKNTKMILSLIAIISAISIQANDVCTDPRAIILSPCEEGKERFFDNTGCQESHKFSNTYCAEREMTNLQRVEGMAKVISMAGVGYDQVFLEGLGAMVFADVGAASNCENSTALVGQDKESVIQTSQGRVRAGVGTELLRFTCND